MNAALRGPVVLTQPALRVAGLIDALSHAGFDVLHWPMSLIEAVPNLDWAGLREELAACRWVLFPSPGAIDVVMQHWADYLDSCTKGRPTGEPGRSCCCAGWPAWAFAPASRRHG